ncbi:MAG: DUF559 domain-containing protein [Gammaproteobacteria bacterium]
MRGRRLDGVKIRRQQVFGPYVVEFFCLDPKVVIEVDGDQHAARTTCRALNISGYWVIA